MKTWDYARTAARYWAFTLAATLAAAAIGYLVLSTRPATYSTSLRVVVGPDAEGAGRSMAESLMVLDRQGVMASLVEVLSSRDILAGAASDLGVQPPDSEAYRNRAAKVPEANIVQLWVEGPDANTVKELASRTASFAIRYFENLYTLYRVQVLDQPSAPDKIAPAPARDALVGAVLVAALAAIGTVAFDQLRTRHGETTSPASEVAPVPDALVDLGDRRMPVDATSGDGALHQRSPQR